MIKLIYKILFPVAQVYWFIFRPKTQGVKCVIEYDGKLLFIKNSYGKQWWTFPGGGFKKNETPTQAVIREIKEEVSMDLKNPKFVGSFKNNHEYKRDNVFVFKEVVLEPSYKIDDEELEVAQWFSVDNLPEIGPVAQKVFDIYKQSS